MSDDQPKVCENRGCGQTFTRRTGETRAKWTVRRYCQPKCAIAVRGKERTTPAASTVRDLPAYPVPPGQVWRPVGFAPTPRVGSS